MSTAPQDDSRGNGNGVRNHDQVNNTTTDSSEVERDLTSSADEFIALLQEECSSLSNAALQSEEEAAEARKNSREAMELAYRYSHRSYNNITTNQVTSAEVAAVVPSLSDDPIFKIENSNLSEEAVSKQNINSINSSEKINHRVDNYKITAAESEEEDVLALLVEITSLKEQLEKERKKHKHALEELEVECAYLKQQLQAAEEDATTALEIAREASQQKQLLENYTQTILEENENLKELLQERQLSNQSERLETTIDTSAAVVPADMAVNDGASYFSLEHHKDDDDYTDREGHTDLTLGVQSVSNGSIDQPIRTHPPSSSREMVSFGRSLLMQYRNKIRDGSPIHGNYNTYGSIYAEAHQHYATSLAKYTERRKALQERTKQYDSIADNRILPKLLQSPSSSSAVMALPRTPALTPDNYHYHPSTIIPYEKLLKLLKDSATRINLENFILTDDSDHDKDVRDIILYQKDPHSSEYTSIEYITKSYCKAVEVRS